MVVSLKQLRYLVAVADEGNFSRAAEFCAVSQPALSTQIRELEAALGCRAVERGAREAVMTPSGREIVRRARRVLDEVREIEQAARWTAGLSGRLALGVIPTVAPYLLPAALPRLRARNLELELGVREMQTEHLLDALAAGRLDAAVIALPAGRGDMVEAALFEDPFLLATSEERLARLGPGSLRPDGIDPDQLLLLDEGHCLADQALAACALERGAARVDLGASSLSTLSRLVASGFGVTFMPAIAARTELAAAPGMRLVPFADPAPRRTVGLIRRRLSVDDGWFSDLATTLTAAAGDIPRLRARAAFEGAPRRAIPESQEERL